MRLASYRIIGAGLSGLAAGIDHLNRKGREAASAFDRRGTPILISTMIVLILLGFARIYTVTTDLQAVTGQLQKVTARLQTEQREQGIQEANACKLRKAGRADTNTHERAPLRAAFNYLGQIGINAAAKQKDPAAQQATRAFGLRFKRYAVQIKPLPNPKC